MDLTKNFIDIPAVSVSSFREKFFQAQINKNVLVVNRIYYIVPTIIGILTLLWLPQRIKLLTIWTRYMLAIMIHYSPITNNEKLL